MESIPINDIENHHLEALIHLSIVGLTMQVTGKNQDTYVPSVWHSKIRKHPYFPYKILFSNRKEYENIYGQQLQPL